MSGPDHEQLAIGATADGTVVVYDADVQTDILRLVAERRSRLAESASVSQVVLIDELATLPKPEIGGLMQLLLRQARCTPKPKPEQQTRERG